MHYQAFLSYSRADRRIALALHRALVRFAKPRFRRPLVSLFRDETGLAVTPALWGAIQAAMDDSEQFVLLASPESAASRWVRQEIEYWLASKGASTMLLVIVGGRIEWDPRAGDFDWAETTALPEVLRNVFPSEPRWVDLREEASSGRPSVRDRGFQEKVASVLAALIHRSKDLLLNDELTERRRDLRLARGAILAIIALLVAASGLGLTAAIQRDEAIRAQATAEHQAKVSLANEYASDALASISSDPERAILLSLEALRTEPTAAAEDALRQSLVASHVRGVVRHVPGTRTYQVGIGSSPVAIAFSPDGQELLSGGGDDLAILSSVPSGRQIAVLAGHSGQLTSVAFSPDGTEALTASRDGTAIVWDLASHLPKTTLAAHTGPVLVAAFSPNGRQVVTGGADGIARVWDAGTGRQVAIMRGHTGTVELARFSPDGSHILTAASDETVRVWDAVTGAQTLPSLPIDRLAANVVPAYVATYSHDGQLIATATGFGVSVWDAATGQTLFTSGPGLVYSSVTSVAFSSDDRLLLAASFSGSTIWDVGSGHEVASFQSGNGLADMVASFSPNNEYVVTANTDGSAHVWNVLSGKEEADLIGHTASVTSAVFSPDGRWVATGSPDGTARIWEVVGNEVAEYPDGSSVPVEYLPTGPPVDAESSPTGTISMISRATGAVRATWVAPDGEPDAITVDAQGSRVALIYQSGALDVFDSGGRPLAALEFAGPGVTARPVFSPDGRWIVAPSAVATQDGALVQELRVWETTDWREVANLSQRTGPGIQDGPVEAIAFSTDSTKLVNGHVKVPVFGHEKSPPSTW
jgi:WD40 repeat protein